MKWTEEQENVVHALDPKFSVRASAGSGKTSVLVERYIRCVVDLNISPENLAAITFTKKAAAEMKSRIVNRLRVLDRPEDAQAAETGPIQTIHSLCERVLREHSVEAVVDPEFKILDGPPRIAMVEAAIRSAILAARDENSFASQLVDRLAGRGTYQSSAASHGKLRQILTTSLDNLRSAGIDRSELEVRYSTPDQVFQYWLSHLVREFPEDIATPVRFANRNDWANELALLLKSHGHSVPAWAKSSSIAGDEQAIKDSIGIVWLCLNAWETLEYEMERTQEFDFALLETKAVTLLSESETARTRIRETIQALMVDESQDLNPMQYRLVESIGANSEMFVGDPQQSIYGFRFADKDLFSTKGERGATYSLTKNHRSDEGILNFVDAVFEPTWTDDYRPMMQPTTDPDDPFGSLEVRSCFGVELWPMQAKDLTTTALMVHQMVKDQGSANGVAVLTRKNAAVKDMSSKLTALGVPNRSVGASATFYTRLEIRDIANALEALSDPRSDHAMLALLRSPFVGLSLDAIVWIAANSPVVEAIDSDLPFDDHDVERLDDFRQWFAQGQRTADRVPAWETISFLLSKTRYLDQIATLPTGNQAIANVRKLLTLATEEPESTARKFSQKIRDIQFMRHAEGEAPLIDDSVEAVTIMSIHRAKGLEFDTVVLPDTHVSFTPHKREIAFDATMGLLVSGLEKPHSAFFSWLSKQDQARATAEELRVLYVALTRARKKLCVVVSEQGGFSNSAELIAQRVGFPRKTLPGIVVRRHKEPE